MAYNRTEPIETEVHDFKERVRRLRREVDELCRRFEDGKIHIAGDSVIDLEGLDFDTLDEITFQGQSVSQVDILPVYDVSKRLLRKISLEQLYDQYLCTRHPSPAGRMGELQIKGGSGFVSTSDIKHNPSKRTLYIDGNAEITNLQLHGRFAAPLVHVTDEVYEIGENDYTVLIDITQNPASVILPDASQNRGRLIHVKLIHQEKYTMKSHPLTIKSAGGLIDYYEEATVKMARSSRTLQSDGENWWVISARGS